MSRPPAPQSGRLFGLDALRGIAAFAVVVMHAHVLYPETPQLAAKAYLAVDFFFVLSGYVMARTYEPRLAGGFGWFAFFAARYRRLWPTMFVGGLLFIPYVTEATADPDPHWLKQVLPNLLLLPSPLSEDLFPLNIPAWSIFFELAANLFHGLILWRFGIKGVAAVSALCGAGLAVAAHRAGSLDLGSGHLEIAAGLLRVGLTYCMGILIWRAWGQRRLPMWTGMLAIAVLPLSFWAGGIPWAQSWLFDFGFVLVVTPLTMLGGLSLNGGGWARWSGELSFPLYATHYAVLYWCRDAGLKPLVSIAACLIIAALLVGVQMQLRHRRRKMSHATVA